MRDQRGLAAHEDRWKLRNVVALEALFDVLHIVKAEADILWWPCDRQAELEALERLARARRRLLGKIGQRLEVAAGLHQHVGQIDRKASVNRLQIDHIVALDHAQARSFVALKS